MEPTKYRVEVSQKAAQMLVSHAAFLAQVSFNAAKRLTASFKEAADSLEIMPQRCSWQKGEHIPKNHNHNSQTSFFVHPPPKRPFAVKCKGAQIVDTKE